MHIANKILQCNKSGASYLCFIALLLLHFHLCKHKLIASQCLCAIVGTWTHISDHGNEHKESVGKHFLQNIQPHEKVRTLSTPKHENEQAGLVSLLETDTLAIQQVTIFAMSYM